MNTVRRILATKGGEFISISPDATVFDALKLMAQKNIGALLVMEGELLAGIITERDYARKVIIHGRSSKNTMVREIMTSKVCIVGPDSSVEECMALMTGKHISHLPVIEEGRVVGILSIRDVLRAVITEKDFNLDTLVKLIVESKSAAKP